MFKLNDCIVYIPNSSNCSFVLRSQNNWNRCLLLFILILIILNIHAIHIIISIIMRGPPPDFYRLSPPSRLCIPSQWLCRKPVIFLTINSDRSNSLCLKYHRFHGQDIPWLKIWQSVLFSVLFFFMYHNIDPLVFYRLYKYFLKCVQTFF